MIIPCFRCGKEISSPDNSNADYVIADDMVAKELDKDIAAMDKEIALIERQVRLNELKGLRNKPEQLAAREQALAEGEASLEAMVTALGNRMAEVETNEAELDSKLKSYKVLVTTVNGFVAKKDRIIDALKDTLAQMNVTKRYYTKMGYPPNYDDLVKAIEVVKEVLR